MGPAPGAERRPEKRRLTARGTGPLRVFSHFVGDIFQNVLHPAVQDLAQGVQGRGGDGLAVLHAVDGIRVYPLFEDQVIFGDPFFQKGLIKRTITDQYAHPA